MKPAFLFLFFVTFFGVSQETWDDFSGEEKAFFYQIARRTDNLKDEIFPLFEFLDSIPYLNDTLPDYKYVEKRIVNSPETLFLHTYEIPRKSSGLVSDLATKYALWELDQVVHYRNTTAVGDSSLKEKFKLFERLVLEEAPQIAVRTLGNGDFVLDKALDGYYAPTLTIGDKKAAIKQSGYNLEDQKLILNAIMTAQERYVEDRAEKVMRVLGWKDEFYVNRINAVGDGDNWSEIEGGFKTPYNRSLPDEIALFNFETEVRKKEKSEVQYLGVKSVTKKSITTAPEGETILHVDVAGYHPERQTTIVIQKGDISYILYGKNDHRLVSPDSSFGAGATYWRLMKELEEEHIATVRYNLYGKKGYEYWIKEYEKRIDKTELLIKKSEYRLDELRHQPNAPPNIKKKKIKKKNLGRSDQDGKGHPTAPLTALDKKRNAEQNRLIHLNTLLQNQKSTRKKLIKEMEEAYFILVKYETLLDRMQKNMGYAVVEHQEKNGVYTYVDGAKFNYRTQDFTFAPDANSQTYQLLHITFGKKVFASSIEENFVHFTESRSFPDEKYVYRKVTSKNTQPPHQAVSDSIQTMEIFRALMNKKVDLKIEVNAGGILGTRNGNYYRDSLKSPVKYEKDAYQEEIVIEQVGNFEIDVILALTVWRSSMMPQDFSSYQKGFSANLKKHGNINEIDLMTAVSAKIAAEKWINLLEVRANKWLANNKEKSAVLKKIKKLKIKKIKGLNGKVEIKV